MDAVTVDVSNYREISEKFGKSCGDKVLRTIGERLRTLARELGGIGSRQGDDTFLIYCPHREDYPEILKRLSENITVEESSIEQAHLRMGVYPLVDKKLDIERWFVSAKAAADTVKENDTAHIGIYHADAE